jgi:hypothetical protein
MVKYGKTEIVYIQGKASWFRAKQPNQWNKYSVQIHPNAEGLEKIRELQSRGLKNTIKKDDDGYFVNFTRPVSKEYKTGKIQTFAPPTVTDKDGNIFEGQVGNGSDVTLKLEVYEHATPAGGRAVAARWASARIDTLVPFELETSGFPSEIAAAQGLAEQPAQLF